MSNIPIRGTTLRRISNRVTVRADGFFEIESEPQPDGKVVRVVLHYTDAEFLVEDVLLLASQAKAKSEGH